MYDKSLIIIWFADKCSIIDSGGVEYREIMEVYIHT